MKVIHSGAMQFVQLVHTDVTFFYLSKTFLIIQNASFELYHDQCCIYLIIIWLE